ncbi:hypothetical protein SDC9_135135 [bioreactor metagenome]|uniref:Uncharacterized protein n=1 Tax=bioreactor metagenome TaxID=1076179 RepID=A0A645DF10_9ZZZZ
MTVIQAREISAGLTGIRDHHAHKADFDDGLLDHFHGGEQAVEVIGTFHQHLQLTSTHTAGRDEAVWHLEVVVIGHRVVHIRADHRGDDLTRGQGRPIMHGDHADCIVGVFNNHWAETTARFDDLGHVLDDNFIITVERQKVHPLFSNDDELGQVESIGTLTQDLALRTLLTTIGQEMSHILEIIGGGIGGQHLHGAQRYTITCKNVTDLPLGDGHQWGDMNHILDGDQVVQAATQHIWLITSLAVQRDKAALDRF